MLNVNRVLSYVKDNLGFPFMQLELEDDKIIEYIQTYTLREFSYYVPEVKKLGLNLNLAANKVAGRANEYYIEDPQGREILNIVEIYFDTGNLMLFNHPPLGPMTHFEIRNWALQTETANQTKSFSSFDYTFEFQHPNIVRISPVPNNTEFVTVEYERVQSSDLSGIPTEYEWTFLQMALADIMVMIGRIRKKYSDQIRTPFGEVPLNAEIYDEGKEMKREILEKLSLGPVMNVIFDRG